MKTIKWGILSTGTIAKNFASTMSKLSGQGELAAVASRDREKAEAFAREYGIPKAFGSYEELAEDPEIDLVYIATPHSAHLENIILCLEHGKNVLCEKAFTVNALQARKAFELARAKNLFMMEAFWTKLLPIYRKAEELISQGVLGEPRIVTAQYGYRVGSEERLRRKFDPALAGGTLLDIGVYNIGFACMFLGYAPRAIHSAMRRNSLGTDEYESILLEYENGAQALLTAAIQTELPLTGCVYGSLGRMEFPQFKNPQSFRVVLNDGTSYSVDLPFLVNGYEYEILEAERCVLQGKKRSEIMMPEQSVAVMEIMDTLRGQWNMSYPCE